MKKIVFNGVEYVEIPNYTNYFVSVFGNIYSLKRNIILSKCKDKNGYEKVGISNSFGRKTFTVHYLVCLTYIGERPHGCDINHIDYNRSNNVLGNLEYLTEKENMLHSLCNIKRNKVYEYGLDGTYLASYESYADVAKARRIWSSNVASIVKMNSKLKTIHGRFYSSEKFEKLPQRIIGKHRPVIVMDLSWGFIKEFYTIKDASIFTGAKHSNISNCCKGIRATAGGFRFKYK